jgi:hypothetical protein
MQPELKLKVMPIRAAVLQAFNQMPNRFSAFTLCLHTRGILGAMTMDGSILRRLRELREDGLTPYKCIDQVNCIYEKTT